MNPGSIVNCRNRDWVLLPSESPDELRLRPLTGATDEVVVLHKKLTDLAGYTFPAERPKPSTFAPPTLEDLSNAAGAHLLWQAARLTLREGAGPFRALGRISIRPRPYQFVPLLMALRLDPVRMLIADDVGVGKTIEAGLIARELLDRGEIRRLAVLCPPYLCEQWQRELSEKFNLDAVIIRSGTIGQLDRAVPRTKAGQTIYRHYPIQVISIDFIKTERNRHAFLQDCPELVIVDEAHGAAAAEGSGLGQQQRHQLLSQLAADERRHLVLLTATPHSGVEAAFRSLLGLLRPEFAAWDPGRLDEERRISLARHFVQRTRADIVAGWEGLHCFPKRVPLDETYPLSGKYHDLFQKTYNFCVEMVRSSDKMGGREQRVRYWGALALLRCVMSSPAAAVMAFENRHHGLTSAEDEPSFNSFIFESSEERTDDSQPAAPVEFALETVPDSERRQLRELGKLAGRIMGTADDSKLARCIEIVSGLLRDGFHPILWCRYIATAEYLAEALRKALAKKFVGLRVIALTGTLSDEERRTKIEEIAAEKVRVLVATDCLSEGINLQHAFNAALHYDLPWNPNRLEQREGRVDRYGQQGRISAGGERLNEVKTIRYFSPDSPVDGVVLDVLLNKAREIHRTLGTHVPVPEESESVTEAVLKALFLRGSAATPSAAPAVQLELELGATEVSDFHRRWDMDAAREKLNRTRFAQRTLKPEEVQRELEATDTVLGDEQAVQTFFLEAAQRLGLPVTPEKTPGAYRVSHSAATREVLPDAIAFALPPAGKSAHWLVSFVSPAPEGAEYLGRNHRFITALAQFLMEEAITAGSQARAARCGVIRTRAVSRLTTILLLRARYLVEQPGRNPQLAEEVHVSAHENPERWLEPAEALRLLSEATPEANVSVEERRELIAAVLAQWPAWQPSVAESLLARSASLADSHRRIRQSVGMKVRDLKVKPQLPPDLLGVVVLQPLV